MVSVTVDNTTVTEVVPAGGSFSPSAGVEMRVNIQASLNGGATLEKGGASGQVANGGNQTIASEITAHLDDTMTVSANNKSVVITGKVTS